MTIAARSSAGGYRVARSPHHGAAQAGTRLDHDQGISKVAPVPDAGSSAPPFRSGQSCRRLSDRRRCAGLSESRASNGGTSENRWQARSCSGCFPAIEEAPLSPPSRGAPCWGLNRGARAYLVSQQYFRAATRNGSIPSRYSYVVKNGRRCARARSVAEAIWRARRIVRTSPATERSGYSKRRAKGIEVFAVFQECLSARPCSPDTISGRMTWRRSL